MKIAFDENVPVQLVRVFTSLGGEKRFRDFEFVSAKDYAPKPSDRDYVRKSDVPWLERFAQDGGKVVISGNVRMMDNPLEMQALRQLGFLVFFFERKWNQWDFFQKSALVLFYWQRVAKKVNRWKGTAGTFWRVPNHFKVDDDLTDCSPGKKKIKKASPRAASKKVKASDSRAKLDGGEIIQLAQHGRKRRLRKTINPNQTALALTGGGIRANPVRNEKSGDDEG